MGEQMLSAGGKPSVRTSLPRPSHDLKSPRLERGVSSVALSAVNETLAQCPDLIIISDTDESSEEKH